MKKILLLLLFTSSTLLLFAQDSETYAVKLGFPKGARIILLHMDDAGMSFDSNEGIVEVLEKGVAPSLSVMMPTPWVPQIVHYLQAHPGTDAGLHLTLTSEWNDYRWTALAGKYAVPGLIDEEGCLWHGVAEVIKHASAEEVDKEIRAQLERAEKMGFHPTHLDSHMGTLFANDAFLEKYLQLGMEKHIPVMFPGGHNTYLRAGMEASLIDSIKKKGQWKEGMAGPLETRMRQMRQLGQMLWNAGLPVLDDLHNDSYGWKVPTDLKNDKALQAWRTRLYEKSLQQLKPGITMVIMHCTAPTEVFPYISDSGNLRKADMLAMLDPQFRKFLQENGFILTTWKELMERRMKIKNK